MKVTRTFELAQALQTGKMYLINDTVAYLMKGFYLGDVVTDKILENVLYRAVSQFHNLASIDNVGEDSITVTYNVRDIKRL